MELLGGFDALEDGANLPVFERSDIYEAWRELVSVHGREKRGRTADVLDAGFGAGIDKGWGGHFGCGGICLWFSKEGLFGLGLGVVDSCSEQ